MGWIFGIGGFIFAPAFEKANDLVSQSVEHLGFSSGESSVRVEDKFKINQIS